MVERGTGHPHTLLAASYSGNFRFPLSPDALPVHPGKAQMGRGERLALCKPVLGNSHPYLLPVTSGQIGHVPRGQ